MPSPTEIRQSVPTTLSCPQCGRTLLLMTRRADGRRFLGCRGYADERLRCSYTENRVPQDILLREAGAVPLPGFGL